MSIHDNLFDLLSEAVEPTGPLLSWKAQVHIKQYIDHPDLSVPQIGQAIAAKLRQCPLLNDPAMIGCFEGVDSERALNAFLDLLYTHCDAQRVLVR